MYFSIGWLQTEQFRLRPDDKSAVFLDKIAEVKSAYKMPDSIA